MKLMVFAAAAATIGLSLSTFASEISLRTKSPPMSVAAAQSGSGGQHFQLNISDVFVDNVTYDLYTFETAPEPPQGIITGFAPGGFCGDDFYPHVIDGVYFGSLIHLNINPQYPANCSSYTIDCSWNPKKEQCTGTLKTNSTSIPVTMW